MKLELNHTMPVNSTSSTKSGQSKTSRKKSQNSSDNFQSIDNQLQSEIRVGLDDKTNTNGSGQHNMNTPTIQHELEGLHLETSILDRSQITKTAELPVPVPATHSLEEFDPSLEDGFELIYENDLCIEIRQSVTENSVSSGVVELVNIKVLINGDEHHPEAIRLEMSSEADLFFHYVHEVDQNNFAAFQKAQELRIGLPTYCNVLVQNLNAVMKKPTLHICVLTLYSKEEAHLDFIQNMEYKCITLLRCDCLRSSDEKIQQFVTFRYNRLKQATIAAKSKLQDIFSMMKYKNPSLLLQINKESNRNK